MDVVTLNCIEALATDAQKMGSKTLHRPDGSKSFPTKRPWMISH